MSETRPHVTASASFSGLPSVAPARPPKRRITSVTDLPFFTPAAVSFNPRPFNTNPAPTLRVLPPVRANTIVPPPMDPSPVDPSAIFIRSPFTAFPNSHLHPEGLTYNLMAANPDWFLDPTDFQSENNTNFNAILYPSELEPPRGWCPALKKELKERGADTWPEGEEPRLRCTFCRRTYAGVNAKSMWRRHVYEKHKIAMSNRRENAERGRGRSSNKETKAKQDKKSFDKENVTFVKSGPIDTVSVQATPSGYDWASDSQKAGPSKNRGGSTSADSSDDETRSLQMDAGRLAFSPRAPPQVPVQTYTYDATISASQLLLQPDTPPLTPRKSLNHELQLSPCGKIELSPYNPLAEPSFRHSPGPLPSEKPWRWDSPSHPLYNEAQELSLSMIVHEATRVTKELDSSPITFAAKSKSSGYFSSPRVLEFSDRARSSSLLADSPNKLATDLLRPSPPRLFTTETILESESRLNSMKDSLTGSLPGVEDGLLPNLEDVFSEHALLGPSYGSPWLADDDSMLSMSVSIRQTARDEVHTPPLSSPETESPVLRSTSVLDLDAKCTGEGSRVGLGIGLLEPFSLDGDAEFLSGEYNGKLDFGGNYMPGSESKLSPVGSRSVGQEFLTGPDDECNESTRASKRRRTSTA